jgi:hypothetical protein
MVEFAASEVKRVFAAGAWHEVTVGTFSLGTVRMTQPPVTEVNLGARPPGIPEGPTSFAMPNDFTDDDRKWAGWIEGTRFFCCPVEAIGGIVLTEDASTRFA